MNVYDVLIDEKTQRDRHVKIILNYLYDNIIYSPGVKMCSIESNNTCTGIYVDSCELIRSYVQRPVFL